MRKIKPRIFRLLRDIYLLKIKKEIYTSEICSMLNISRGDPDINFTINFMIENNLAKFRCRISKAKIITINNSSLEEYIRNNCDEFKKWGKFIEISKPFDHNY